MKTYKIDNVEINEKELRKLIADNPELTKKTRWRADIHEKYWYISNISCYFSDEYNNSSDKSKYLIGNYYETEELAKKELEKRLAIVRVNDFIDENYLRIEEINWKDMFQCKYEISYSYLLEKFVIDVIRIKDVKSLFRDIKSIEACNLIIKECIDDLNLIWEIE